MQSLCQIHLPSHSQEELLIDRQLFGCNEGDVLSVQAVSVPGELIVLRVPPCLSHRPVPLSLLKGVADLLRINNFAKVTVQRLNEIEQRSVELKYVEMAFRKQFLQRGNLWRYKQAMIGRTVHLGMSNSIGGLQAQVQVIKLIY